MFHVPASFTVEGEVEFDILNVLEFDATRKRMSVVVRHPLTKEIILYTKGADSSVLSVLSRKYKGVSYAELRYEVPTLGNSGKPEKMDTSYSAPPPGVSNYSTTPPGIHAVNHNDHSQHGHSSQFQGGTMFSVTGNSKPQLHRIPSEYDVPPLPAPRSRNPGSLEAKKDGSEASEIPLPARRDRLRESQESNKENKLGSINEEHVIALVGKGYDRLKVMEALRVSKSNVEMAEEILKAFVLKQT